MFAQGIYFYDVVLTVHIVAVVVAFGVTFAYPLMDAYARKSNPGDLVALHRFQIVVTKRLIQPAMVVILLAGLYLALDRWKLSDPWISAGFAILIVMFGLAGAVFGPTEKRCLELAQRDRNSGGGLSPEYLKEAHKFVTFGSFFYVLMIATIFLMVAKPGA